MSDPAPERPAGAPGELTGRVGKYEIRHQLGKGAMGVVYRAYDTVLERDVALKVMVVAHGRRPRASTSASPARPRRWRA